VPDIANQESVVQSLKSLFDNITIVDRRKQPSHGYRAVHVIVTCLSKTIEIQVRTSLQHLWAELSEKFSDVMNPAIKYGGGDERIQTTLIESSSLVANQEALEVQFADTAAQLSLQDSLTEEKKQEIDTIHEGVDKLRQDIYKLLHDSIERVEKIKGEGNDISD
jgi:putative GTP pyrophosphokinase